jgi:hypothetical protein
MIIVWLAVYPTLTGLQALIGPRMEHWPPPLQTLLMVTIMVPLMTYAVVPAWNRLIERWLRGGAGERKKGQA